MPLAVFNKLSGARRAGACTPCTPGCQARAWRAESQKQYWRVKQEYRQGPGRQAACRSLWGRSDCGCLGAGTRCCSSRLASSTSCTRRVPVLAGTPRARDAPHLVLAAAQDDAQIGHEVLQWRMTITGVGHCRQVLSALGICAGLLAGDLAVTPAWQQAGRLPRVRHRRGCGSPHSRRPQGAPVARHALRRCMQGSSAPALLAVRETGADGDGGRGQIQARQEGHHHEGAHASAHPGHGHRQAASRCLA